MEAVEIAEQEFKQQPKVLEAKEQVATYLHMMAYILTHRKSYEKAAIAYTRSIEMWETINGEKSKKKLIGLWSDCAKFFEIKGDFDQSLKLLEKCEQVIVEEKGKNNKDYSALLVAKAQILTHQKNLDGAEKLFHESISCVGEGYNQVSPTKS